MNLHVDLGQIIIASLIGIVGYLIKREVTNVGNRLDRHEKVIFEMNGAVTRAIGEIGILFSLLNVERRKELRNREE